MKIRATADHVRVTSDETGFHLLIDTTDGDTIDLRVEPVAKQLAEVVAHEIGRWVDGMDAA